MCKLYVVVYIHKCLPAYRVAWKSISNTCRSLETLVPLSAAVF